jgi:hypothetical protein
VVYFPYSSADSLNLYSTLNIRYAILYTFKKINPMEPPANPIDLKIILGDEEGQQNLVNAEFALELGPNAVRMK